MVSGVFPHTEGKRVLQGDRDDVDVNSLVGMEACPWLLAVISTTLLECEATMILSPSDARHMIMSP